MIRPVRSDGSDQRSRDVDEVCSDGDSSGRRAFCRVMLSDCLTAKQAEGAAREEVEVAGVAQLLLASVKRG